MKNNKIIIYIVAILFSAITFQSCLKSNKQTFTDFSKTTDFVILQNSGIANFGGEGNIVITDATPDTLTLTLYSAFASKAVASSDINVTVAVDDAQRTAYNATSAVNFLAFPDSFYRVISNKMVIKSGQQYAATTIEVYKAKVDLTKSWMLPISITNAGGQQTSGNFNTMYYHIIGNPLAGSYKWDYSRWNATDSSGAKHSSSFVGDATTFLPVTPTQIEVKSGYYINPKYEITFQDNGGGSYTNFKVAFNDVDLKTMTDAGVNVIDGPNLWVANPITGEFKIQYTVFNGTANRYLIDRFYK